MQIYIVVENLMSSRITYSKDNFIHLSHHLTYLVDLVLNDSVVTSTGLLLVISSPDPVEAGNTVLEVV